MTGEESNGHYDHSCYKFHSVSNNRILDAALVFFDWTKYIFQAFIKASGLSY